MGGVRIPRRICSSEAAQALQRKRGQESMEQVHQQRFTEQESQHDACGIGAVVNISGQRTHRAVDDALKIVEKLEHRTGKDADALPAMASAL